MQKLKVSDEIIVLSGKDKGKTGKIKYLDYKGRNVVVNGINMVSKTVKASQENPDGGITKKESVIDISNIALISPQTKSATRIRIENRDGRNVRVAVKCGTVID